MKRAALVEKEETTRAAKGTKPQRRGMEAAATKTVHYQNYPTRLFCFACGSLLLWQQKQQQRSNLGHRLKLCLLKGHVQTAGSA